MKPHVLMLLVLLALCPGLTSVVALSQAGKPAQPAEKKQPDPAPVKGEPKAAQSAHHYIILKTGEEGAVSHKAGDVLVKLGMYMGSRIIGEGKVYEGHITNKPDDALKLVKEHKPQWGFVTPAFFLANRETLKMRVLYESRRNGAMTEVYSIFYKGEGKKLEDFKGKRVATTLAADTAWLDKVVLEGKPGPQWVAVDNLSDAIFAILDGEKGACDGVLGDRITTELFKEDAELSKLFSVAWKSDELPPDLVVVFEDNVSEAVSLAIESHLDLMKNNPEGVELLKTLQTASWGEVNKPRLDVCAKLLGVAALGAGDGAGKDADKKPADKASGTPVEGSK